MSALDICLKTYCWFNLGTSALGLPFMFAALYKLARGTPRPWFMIGVMSMFCVCVVVNSAYVALLLRMESYLDYYNELGFALYLGCVAASFFLAATWTLSFKNWQTAYEIDYLFRAENPVMTKRKKRLYLCYNITGYFLSFAPYFIETTLTVFRPGVYDVWNIVWSNLEYVAYVYVTAFYIVALRRIRKHVARIPVLKQSEQYFIWTATSFVIMTVLVTVLCNWYGSAVIWLKNDKANFFVSGLIIFYLAIGIFSTIVVALVTYMAYHYNTPRLRTKNLKDDVSMLMFVNQKTDMQKIFDHTPHESYQDQINFSRSSAATTQQPHESLIEEQNEAVQLS